MISYDISGSGPTIVFASGAFNDKDTCRPLAQALESQFTCVLYDRRGRGGSHDIAPPYTVEQEVEDLDWLIGQVGGPVHVFGFSSGAVLALHAVASGLPIQKLALYEPPSVVDAVGSDHVGPITRLVEAGHRGEAVEYFQTEIIGMPVEIVHQIRNAPFRASMEAIAPSLVHDVLLVSHVSSDLVSSVKSPALVIVGAESPSLLHDAGASIAAGLPHGSLVTLEGQTHDLVPSAIVPVMAPFLT
ncbi:alpha/beta fold hydrolase [Nonomuraea sp. NPDC050556]|uniref:alpha/beta fold hydrolase n=1 Tax=Nonomuraea sp. NPDC050556 TaxID=3364369 RepID=UPI0037AF0E6F